MKKKKDYLLDTLKKQEQIHLMDFLSTADIAMLALTAKRYYMQLIPLLNTIRLDLQPTQIAQKTQKKGKKRKNKEESPQPVDNVEVEIEKMPLHKFIKMQKYQKKWVKIDQLDIQNDYLSKKMESNTVLFYKQPETNALIYINRSLVDPALNYNKGGFGDDFVNESIYSHFYQQSESQVLQQDFSSMEAILKRQRQLLSKTNLKKEEEEKKEIVDYQKELERALSIKRIGIILCFGGSFSFGIFEGGRCILHKSDKKYVCRKKAGERQLNKDKQSGSSIQSMGSQIRRDQEKKHIINVGQILKEHHDDLASCEIIFLQAPGLNRLFVINQKQNLDGLQNRLRSVCLTARKANFTEVESLYQAISKVNIVKLADRTEEKAEKKEKRQKSK